MGTVILWPLAGYIMETMGWVWAFYLPALFTILTTFVWYYVVYDSPAEHPRITSAERDHIEASLGKSVSSVRVRLIKSLLLFWQKFEENQTISFVEKNAAPIQKHFLITTFLVFACITLRRQMVTISFDGSRSKVHEWGINKLMFNFFCDVNSMVIFKTWMLPISGINNHAHVISHHLLTLSQNCFPVSDFEV